jgi:hypothetical protein
MQQKSLDTSKGPIGTGHEPLRELKSCFEEAATREEFLACKEI